MLGPNYRWDEMTALDTSLDLHRQALRSCRRCGHAHDVQPIVSVARSPRIMIIGQAPGKTEAAGGRPFAGRAGRTLFQWFSGIGLDEATVRSRVYISAITRCYPGPSAGGRGDRVPGPAERSNCSEWLAKELRLIRPALIVPVGRLAIDAFLGPRPLEEVIGREHPPAYDSAGMLAPEALRSSSIIPLPHPSGASSWIHTGNHRELLNAALRLIAERWTRVVRGRVA